MVGRRLMKLDPIELYGTWTGAEIERFLTENYLPLRLSFESRNGPIIVSLWFEYRVNCLVCCSPEGSMLVTSLSAKPDVAFDVSTNDLPYRGVRGRGRATCTTAADNTQLEKLLTRYLGSTEGQLAQWLLNRSGREAVIAIEPVWLTSWDFSERMQDLTKISRRLPDSAL